MAEQDRITSLYVTTDSENSYDNIGDIEGGGFDSVWLKKHIKSHGTEQLLERIAFMNYQVYETLKEIRQEKYEEQEGKNGTAKIPVENT